MTSVREVQERILERISVLDALELSVSDAHGCVLSETVAAPEDLPPFATAAIDGFAMRSEDASGAESTPVSLTIVGEAGGASRFVGKLARGEAVRVSAGTALPEGVDAVVRAADVAVVGSSMAIGRSLRPGENVRPAGQDVAKGDPVMHEGQRVRGMDIGVLAALGKARVTVRPRPRVVVLPIGDDLCDPGQPLGPGLVRDSNSYLISAVTREAAAEPTRGGIVGNDASKITEKFKSFLPQADVFVTTGGVEEEDGHVRQAVMTLGEVDAYDPAIAPHATLLFGVVDERPVFGLPGDPVAALVVFELFVRPALLKMAGRTTLQRPEVEAVAEDSYEHEGGRTAYLGVRALRDGPSWRVRLSANQGPTLVSSMGGANALAVLGAEQRVVAPGDAVRLLLLEPLEGW